jgi:small subunit ribosomal protein S1
MTIDENKENEILEEVNEEVETRNPMEDYINQIDESMERIEVGDIVTCKVIAKTNDELSVDLGYMADGIIEKSEIDFEGGNSIEEINIGDEITAKIVKIDNGEGSVLLSKKRADAELVWDDLNYYKENDRHITTKINEVVKGGVIGKYKGLRVFIPASQISIDRIEDLETVVGMELNILLTEVSEEKKNVVGSHRIIEQREKDRQRKEILDNIEIYDVLLGKVVKIESFGAFVDLGGMQGLIHISNLSWKRVKHPSEVVQIGDEVKVKVIDIKPEEGKIGLSLADFVYNPWSDIEDILHIEDIKEGVVTKLQNFGAFVQLSNGIEGLVHISQICDEHIKSPAEKLEVGQTIKVKILNIDKENRKLSLSIKETLEREADFDYEEFLEDEAEESTLGDVLAEKLKGFKIEN